MIASSAPAPSETAAGRSSSRIPEILKSRADFLAAARAKRATTAGFVLQARRRAATGPVRVGFTCSKKVGGAVARNRAKRRLREIARLTLPEAGLPGWDYVLIGRREVTGRRSFERLRRDLSRALAEVHG